MSPSNYQFMGHVVASLYDSVHCRRELHHHHHRMAMWCLWWEIKILILHANDGNKRNNYRLMETSSASSLPSLLHPHISELWEWDRTNGVKELIEDGNVLLLIQCRVLNYYYTKRPSTIQRGIIIWSAVKVYLWFIGATALSTSARHDRGNNNNNSTRVRWCRQRSNKCSSAVQSVHLYDTVAGWLWTDALVSQHIRVEWSSSGEESKGNAALIAWVMSKMCCI